VFEPLLPPRKLLPLLRPLPVKPKIGLRDLDIVGYGTQSGVERGCGVVIQKIQLPIKDEVLPNEHATRQDASFGVGHGGTRLHDAATSRQGM
jgi:hypothetical protein